MVSSNSLAYSVTTWTDAFENFYALTVGVAGGTVAGPNVPRSRFPTSVFRVSP